MQIQTTKTYSQFKVVGGNRAIHEKHLKELMASISATNMLEVNPIIVNRKMEVIDGQHRLEAAKRMHLPIFYIVATSAELKEVQRLNTAVKRWELRDFAVSYAFRGNEEYQKLLNFSERFRIGMSESIMMTQKVVHKWGNAIYEFKEGNHVCDNLDEAEKVAKSAVQIARFVEPQIIKKLPDEFVRSVRTIEETKPVSTLAFIERLTKNGQKIPRQSETRDWLRAFEAAYNWHISKNQVRFF